MRHFNPTTRSDPITTETPRDKQSEQYLRSRRHACLCAQVADSFRGQNTVVLDLTGITPITDFFVLTTGTSRRQNHAIAEEVDDVLNREGSQRIGLEGYQDSGWILQDYGDVVLHVFTPETREMYDLESLWADAEPIDWQAILADSETSGTNVSAANTSASNEDPSA